MNSKKTWETAVYESCLLEADINSKIFTRKNLIKNRLNYIINKTCSVGTTPSQTMSRTLQLLRDFGLVKFISKGTYELTKSTMETAIFNKNKMSRGEKLIKHILDDMGIQYKQEVIYPDLKYKSYLRFDFEITYKSRKFIIEVDGVQHERPVEFFGGIEKFAILKQCDEIKNNYCLQRNIPILRLKTSQLVRQIAEEKIKHLIEFESTLDNA